MEIALNNLLNACIIVPYDDDTIDRFTNICDTYINRHDEIDDLSNLAICLFAKKWDSRFHKELENIYLDTYATDIKLPKCTLKAFATYIINGILNKHEDDGIYALAVMNCLILLNNHFNETPYPDVFMAHIDTFHKYFKECEELEDDNTDNVFLTVFPNYNEGAEAQEDIETDNFNDINSSLQSLLRDAWYFRTIEYIQTVKNEADGNISPFTLVFSIIYNIVDKMPWLFINNRVRHMMSRIVSGFDVETVIPLKDILKKIDIEDSITLSTPHHSSILLRLLMNDTKLSDLDVTKTTLNLKDFAMYLYYELLLEKSLN